MTYQNFLSEVTSLLSERFDNETTITIQTIKKNNGISYDGLIIREGNINIAPTIYLNTFYNEYCAGKSLDDIVCSIFELYHMHKCEANFDASFFLDYNHIKDKIVLKLINTEMNNELLKDVPSLDYLDLSVVFCLCLSIKNDEVTTILLHNEHIKNWNVSLNELYDVALHNTPKLLSSNIINMADFMLETLDLSSIDINIEEIMLNPMYILTNKVKLNGASCILYEDLLKNFATTVNSDLYIIPSSIHEVLILPSSNIHCVDDLNKIIEMVNSTELKKEDILSNHAYIYSRNSCKLTF